jgi:type I restriction-modification system DNA methylase subunit
MRCELKNTIYRINYNYMPTYFCKICMCEYIDNEHIENEKHNILKNKLETIDSSALEKIYKTSDVEVIIQKLTKIIKSEDVMSDELNDIFNDDDTDIMEKMDYVEVIQQTNTISNKDALKSKIHEIHNYMRNNGIGYGMNALKVFNLLYGLKKIEENGLIDKVGLKRPICEFSYLVKLAKENKNVDLTHIIFNDVLDCIHDDSKIKNLLFYEVPKHIREDILGYIIKEINKITEIEKRYNVLLSGKIYEYFIGRDETAISELGAYFTDRHITDFIFDKLNPSIKDDGSVPTMIDMFGGSGGFTTGYIDFLNKKYPKKIDWETELEKVYHFDINADVIKSAGLEMLCLTHVLPNTVHNLRSINAFKHDFRPNEKNQYFHYVITNPPYGGDKNMKSDEQIKREKVKEFIKKQLISISDPDLRKRRMAQLKAIEKEEKKDNTNNSKVSLESCRSRIQRFAKEHDLKGNDKEACSLILMMEILAEGGTAIGVLKEGVYFNKSYSDLRRCLIENFNVREVISVPADQFENTTTKTSIIIFDNTEEKTREVRFSNLMVEKYTEDRFVELLGDIVLIENKDDIKSITDKEITVATREQILSNKIVSLNGKDYNKKEIVCGEGYELVRLGDICKFMPKSKRKASYGKEEGKYNFYTSSDKIRKCDEADYNEECLIVGSGGVANIKIDNLFSCSADNFVLKSKYNTYIYSLFKGNMWLLSDGFKGSTLKHLSKEYLQNLQIPIPKSPDKIRKWVDRITTPYNEKIEKERKIRLPKNKQLIEDLEPTFQEIEQLQHEVKEADKLYKQLIQELGDEAILKKELKTEDDIPENTLVVPEVKKKKSDEPVEKKKPTRKPKKIIVEDT